MTKRGLMLGAFVCAWHAMGAVAGQAAPANDIRAVINVSESERSLVLEEMRDFLHGLHSISMALGRRDMNGVALAARPMGMIMHRIPKSMQERLPEAFVQMGLGQHEIFEVIARDAVIKKDPELTLGQLSEALTYCSGCHDTYRFVVGRPDKAAR
jgi:hypothetical protein